MYVHAEDSEEYEYTQPEEEGKDNDELPIISIPDFAHDSREVLKGTLKDCVELRNALDSR